MNARNEILKLVTRWESRDPKSMRVTSEWSSPSPGFSWRLTDWQGEHTEAVQAVCDAGTQIPYHAHPDHDELICVISGQLDITIVNRSYTITKGQTITVPRGMLHKATYPLKSTILFVFDDS